MPDTPHPASHSARRVIVGVNGNGASAVIEDERELPAVDLPNGIRIQEVWQQRELPAHPTSAPVAGSALGPNAPTEGAVVRILTIPPAQNETPALPDLHTDEALHVFTMLSGQLVAILEDGTTTLEVGDSIIFRGNLHDLRNDQPDEATIVYTSFPLTRQEQRVQREAKAGTL